MAKHVRKNPKSEAGSFASSRNSTSGKLTIGQVSVPKKGYRCPNCDSDKPTMRGKCPVCKYAGLR